MKNTKTVKARELSNVKMVAGNEKKYPVVIHEGRRKRWVGMGWVDEDRASATDKKKYPKVIE